MAATVRMAGSATAKPCAAQPANQHWYATVIAEKSAHVHPSRATSARERSRSRTKPNAAQPSTLGTRNARKPVHPQSLSMMNGRYMPMHHVQLDVQ